MKGACKQACLGPSRTLWLVLSILVQLLTLTVISVLLGRCTRPSEGRLIDVLMSMEAAITGCKSAHKTHMSRPTIHVPGPGLVFPKLPLIHALRLFL